MKLLTKILVLVICLGCGCSSHSSNNTNFASEERTNTVANEQNKKISKEIRLLRKENGIILEIKANSLFIQGSANLDPKKFALLDDVKYLINKYRPSTVIVGVVGKLVAGDALMGAHYWGRIQTTIDYLWRAREEASFIHSDQLSYDISKPETIRIELLDFYV